MNVTTRRVARAMRPGGTENIEIGTEELGALEQGQVLVRVAAVGLNPAETLLRRGDYVVKVPFPFVLGGEGSGTVAAVGAGVSLEVGMRVCWGAVPASCGDFLLVPATMLTLIPAQLSFEQAASVPVAAITAGGLARVWPLDGRSAVVWGAAGAVGRMLVAILARRGVDVIGIASGKRVSLVLEAGAKVAVDRSSQDVREAVMAHTKNKGVAAVFDPIGKDTFEISLGMLAARGCLITYGELSGAAPAIALQDLFRGSLFVTKFNGMRWVEGMNELPVLAAEGVALAAERTGLINEVAGRFPLERAAEAYAMLETNPGGKVLVVP
jgi:NADPH2:quinone reductase